MLSFITFCQASLAFLGEVYTETSWRKDRHIAADSGGPDRGLSVFGENRVGGMVGGSFVHPGGFWGSFFFEVEVKTPAPDESGGGACFWTVRS